jgi:hypothetical protein
MEDRKKETDMEDRKMIAATSTANWVAAAALTSGMLCLGCGVESVNERDFEDDTTVGSVTGETSAVQGESAATAKFHASFRDDENGRLVVEVQDKDLSKNPMAIVALDLDSGVAEIQRAGKDVWEPLDVSPFIDLSGRPGEIRAAVEKLAIAIASGGKHSDVESLTRGEPNVANEDEIELVSQAFTIGCSGGSTVPWSCLRAIVEGNGAVSYWGFNACGYSFRRSGQYLCPTRPMWLVCSGTAQPCFVTCWGPGGQVCNR